MAGQPEPPGFGACEGVPLQSPSTEMLASGLAAIPKSLTPHIAQCNQLTRRNADIT